MINGVSTPVGPGIMDEDALQRISSGNLIGHPLISLQNANVYMLRNVQLRQYDLNRRSTVLQNMNSADFEDLAEQPKLFTWDSHPEIVDCHSEVDAL